MSDASRQPDEETAEPGIPGGCARHPQAPAAYVCDGCQTHLCAACIDEGHRLKMCKLCGEMALPLGREPGGPDSLRQVVRSSDPTRPGPPPEISLSEVLLFPIRGIGIWLLGAYSILAVLLELLGAWPVFRLVMLPVLIVLPLMLGSLFLRIIRTTAAGSNEMPDWPEWDLQERLEDVLKLVSVLLVSTIPVLLALLVAGCLGSDTAPRCVVAGLIGSAVGILFAVVALGAAAIYDDLTAAFRIDLHIQAMQVFGKNLFFLVAFSMVLYLLGGVVFLVVSQVPIFAGLLGLAVNTYCLFLGAHLVGLLFRRHESEIIAVYME